MSLVTEPNMLKTVTEKRDYDPPVMNLDGLDFTVKKGQCIALIGKVGSGKSSMLSCLFGDLYDIDQRGLVDYGLGLEKPSIKINGKISYVGQNSWIRSLTLKENILFSEKYDEKRYQEAIKYSALTDDLKQLADGDSTILGDKGVNLSGGQKVRLTIARALYNNPDIYLLDDPISALDVGVGKYIMDETITKYLEGKTRVIATHAVQFLPYFDYIYIVDKGKIIKGGDYSYIKDTKEYEEIVKVMEENKRKSKDDEMKKTESKNSETTLNKLNSVLSTLSNDSDVIQSTPDQSPSPNRKKSSLNVDKMEFNEEDVTPNPIEEDVKNNLDQANLEKQPSEQDNLVKESVEVDVQEKLIHNILHSEDRATGSVSFKVIKSYFKMAGGMYIFAIFGVLIVAYVTAQGSSIWYLQHWSSGKSSKNKEERPMEEIVQFL